jgi:Solute carrier family 35
LRRYSAGQVVSATLAVSGLATLLLFDRGSSASPQDATVQGDLLVIIGATGYGVNNVLSEHVLKTGDPAEFLAGLGTFGLLFSSFTIPLFERGQLAAAPWTGEMLLLLAVYAVAMLMFSLGMPVLLHKSGSTGRLYALYVRVFHSDRGPRKARGPSFLEAPEGFRALRCTTPAFRIQTTESVLAQDAFAHATCALRSSRTL